MNIIQIGIGQLDKKIVQYFHEHNGVKVVATVDINPEVIDRNPMIKLSLLANRHSNW